MRAANTKGVDWISVYAHIWMVAGVGVGPLTLKFDRATLPFLKIDMRHEAYRHGGKYN